MTTDAKPCPDLISLLVSSKQPSSNWSANDLPASHQLVANDSETHHFATRLLTWFDQHGRHDLPWQVKDDPYKVWVSEIMLQQTQVKTVLNYFDRFITRFPSVDALAQVSWDEVAPYWAGLGYYARARNLHKAAQHVVAQDGFPQTLDGWMELPGIGRSTAGALMSLGLQRYGVIMDGNVKRVLTRYTALEGDSMSSAVVAKLWQLAERYTPVQRNAAYTQAIMDLGATVCTSKKPLCLYCPLNQDCQAFLQQRVLEFPHKKAAKATPERHAQVLILQNAQSGQWLWQQRPSHGLWGGLYCLPIIEDEQQLLQFKQQFQLQVSQTLPVIKHSFTHFSWFLTPLVIELNAEQTDAMQLYFANSQWFDAAQAVASGLPKAMLTLIELANQKLIAMTE